MDRIRKLGQLITSNRYPLKLAGLFIGAVLLPAIFGLLGFVLLVLILAFLIYRKDSVLAMRYGIRHEHVVDVFVAAIVVALLMDIWQLAGSTNIAHHKDRKPKPRASYNRDRASAKDLSSHPDTTTTGCGSYNAGQVNKPGDSPQIQSDTGSFRNGLSPKHRRPRNVISKIAPIAKRSVEARSTRKNTTAGNRLQLSESTTTLQYVSTTLMQTSSTLGRSLKQSERHKRPVITTDAYTPVTSLLTCKLVPKKKGNRKHVSNTKVKRSTISAKGSRKAKRDKGGKKGDKHGHPDKPKKAKKSKKFKKSK